MITKAAALILFVCVIAYPDASGADIIKCTYTEPFVSTIYNTMTNELTVTDDSKKEVTRLTKISIQIIKSSVFELWNEKQAVIQRMDLNLKGGDGMSDKVYPYDATYFPQQLRGGCISNHIH